MERWAGTFTGKKFDVFHPIKEDIDIRDIAHGLALKCRFNGQCKTFYSVAQHCCLMVMWNLPGDPSWKLMHDSAEAYLPDVQRPIKSSLIGFEQIEEYLLKKIEERFNLPYYNKAEIKKSDNILLATEGRDLINNNKDWIFEEKPYNKIINPWSWQTSEKMFLTIAESLGIK